MKLPILISLSLTPGSAPKARPAENRQSAVTPVIRTFEATSLSCPSCAIRAKAFPGLMKSLLCYVINAESLSERSRSTALNHVSLLQATTLVDCGGRLTVFPEAALSEGRSRVPTVARRWRAPQLRLSEGRRRVPALVRLWQPPYLLLP